jgi:hypothetical protein
MTSQEHEPDRHELEPFESKLLAEFQRSVSSEVSNDESLAIWNAMRSELQSGSSEQVIEQSVVANKGGTYLSFRNLLAVAAVGLLVALSSLFMVAAKQRRDGTVISTVTHVEQLMRRGRNVERTKQEWLPEEREIWKQLMGQTANGIDRQRSVVLEK